jgi:hypothetical protein
MILRKMKMMIVILRLEETLKKKMMKKLMKKFLGQK